MLLLRLALLVKSGAVTVASALTVDVCDKAVVRVSRELIILC